MLGLAGERDVGDHMAGNGEVIIGKAVGDERGNLPRLRLRDAQANSMLLACKG